MTWAGLPEEELWSQLPGLDPLLQSSLTSLVREGLDQAEQLLGLFFWIGVESQLLCWENQNGGMGRENQNGGMDEAEADTQWWWNPWSGKVLEQTSDWLNESRSLSSCIIFSDLSLSVLNVGKSHSSGCSQVKAPPLFHAQQSLLCSLVTPSENILPLAPVQLGSLPLLCGSLFVIQNWNDS